MSLQVQRRTLTENPAGDGTMFEVDPEEFEPLWFYGPYEMKT